MTEPEKPKPAKLEGKTNKFSKDSPDFVLTKYSISTHPDWQNEDGKINPEIFADIKKEFEIDDDYPIEIELVEAFIRYTQDRDSLNPKAKKMFVKSLSKRLKSTEKLIKELRSLSGAEEMYLCKNLASNKSSFREQQSQLRDLRRALTTAISDLSEKSKVGRELDIATINLAANLQDIFIRSSNLDPKIYKSEYGDSGYKGTLYEFAARICEIFKTKTETNLYSKLLTAYKFKKTNPPKE